MNELFTQSRSAADSRSILSLMREDSEQLGLFKVRSVMRELDLASKQPGSHTYKRATVERFDIPNTLNRGFNVPAPNQVWCSDITDIYLGARKVALPGCRLGSMRALDSRVGVVIKKPGADLVIKVLDVAHEQRGKPQGLLSYPDQESQYASHLFRQRLRCYRMCQSMGC